MDDLSIDILGKVFAHLSSKSWSHNGVPVVSMNEVEIICLRQRARLAGVDGEVNIIAKARKEGFDEGLRMRGIADE